MPPRPTHKRTASSGGPGPSSGTTKKTRFAEPGEDQATFAEQVDASLETANRKGRVRTEGYDSDSSDDGEGVVPSRRPGAKEEDDDDMFAMGEKEEAADAGKGDAKKEEFLRLGDIEGQEFAKGEGSGSGSSGEDEPEDEDDAIRKSKAGMGYELSSFNMREEMEEGKFSADGMYVRTFDEHAAHDRWMDGLDEREMKAARRRKRQREKQAEERARAEEQEVERLGGQHAMEIQVLAMLKKGETVLEALQRLGAQAKKQKAGQKKTKRPATGTTLDHTVSMEVDKPKREDTPVERLTHLASTLMSFGDVDIYSKQYEELVRSVRRSGTVEDGWEPPSADVRYEYKWDVPDSQAKDGEVFGPFSEEEMQAWNNAAYFGAAGEKVKVRAVDGEWGSWEDVVPS